MTVIGYEVSEQLDVEPARYVVVVTKPVFWLIWNR